MAVMALGASCAFADTQGRIATWTMEDSTAGAPLVTYGSGVASRGAGISAASPEYVGGISPTPVAAWSSVGFATVSSSAAYTANDYVEFDVSTAGFSKIWFTFDARRSDTGPTSATVYYSTDGINYTSSGTTFTVSNASAGTGSPFYTDLTSIAGLDNNPNAKFRIYAWNGAAAGTLRFDNVGVIGTNTNTPTINTSSYTVVSPEILLGDASTYYRHVAVNSNPASPHYGYVYVVNQSATGHVKVMEPNPLSAGTAATSYRDTGWTIQTSTGVASNPAGIAINYEDDSIWMAYAVLAGAIKIERAPHPDDDHPITTGTVVFTPTESATGVSVRSMAFTGKTADNSAKVFLDNSVTASGSSYRMGYKMDGSGGWIATSFLAKTDRGYPSYGSAVDDTGISYFAKGIATNDRYPFWRYNADGTTASGLILPPSWVPNTAGVPTCALYGNFLYYSAPIGSKTSSLIVLCFDLAGNYNWGFGPPLAGAPADGSYQILNITSSQSAYYMATDDRGNLYMRAVVGGNSSTIKIEHPAMRRTVGGPVTSSPVSYGGTTYFGSNDGNVYAINSSTGANVTGYPRDLKVAGGGLSANAGRQIIGRVTLRSIGATNYLFLTTNDGYVVCLTASDGQIVWATQRITATALDTTPSVTTPDPGTLATAYVYVSLTDGASIARVDKLSALDGSLVAQSANLATTGSLAISSPSVNGAGAFVCLSGAAAAGYRLNLGDLSVATSIGTGSAFGAPYMTPGYSTYPRVIIGSTTGLMSAFNASNGAAVYQDVDITPSTTPALSIPHVFNNVAYFGGSDGVIYSSGIDNPSNGSVFYSGASGATVSGLAIDPVGINGAPALCFGDSAGNYHKVLISDPTKVSVQGLSTSTFTTPSIDTTTSCVMLGNADSKVYRVERK